MLPCFEHVVEADAARVVEQLHGADLVLHHFRLLGAAGFALVNDLDGVVAAVANDAPPGAYNLADDLPTSQNAVIEEACRLLGCAPPPLVTMDQADLSPMARGFYAENRRVANGKAKRVLGWEPAYPTYREGLAAILAEKA